MKRLMHSLFALSLFVPVTALVGGCASSGPAKPSGPVDIKDARYKMIVAGGQMDGRSVVFRKRGDGFMGCLVEPGRRLANVAGLDIGIWVFSVRPKGNNEYEGMYRNIGPDGSMSDKEVNLFFDGDNMTWNLESATWERQEGGEPLTDEQKKRCFQ